MFSQRNAVAAIVAFRESHLHALDRSLHCRWPLGTPCPPRRDTGFHRRVVDLHTQSGACDLGGTCGIARLRNKSYQGNSHNAALRHRAFSRRKHRHASTGAKDRYPSPGTDSGGPTPLGVRNRGDRSRSCGAADCGNAGCVDGPPSRRSAAIPRKPSGISVVANRL